jgi:ribonucleotide reductase beta subunit family protein with ferritin-like domain
MALEKKAPIQRPQDEYIIEYPQALAYADMQQHIIWPHTEYPVEDDIQSVLVSNTESETYAVTYGLRLFTKYELFAGSCYWNGRVTRMYPKPCIRTMAATFGMVEMQSHARFYNKLNEALHLDTPEFLNSYKEDPVLVERMKFLEDIMSGDNDLASVAVFSMVEGAILYSTFAFFKHFRHGGKSKYKNLVSGISASARDENIHAEGGAWLYRTHRDELELSEEELRGLEAVIIEAAKQIEEHESAIIDNMFVKGSIEGITPKKLKNFVQSRLNLCLKNLGIPNQWKVGYNPIADWFYDDINAVTLHDFFDTSGSQYNRNWAQDRFEWPEHLKEGEW